METLDILIGIYSFYTNKIYVDIVKGIDKGTYFELNINMNVAKCTQNQVSENYTEHDNSYVLCSYTPINTCLSEEEIRIERRKIVLRLKTEINNRVQNIQVDDLFGRNNFNNFVSTLK